MKEKVHIYNDEGRISQWPLDEYKIEKIHKEIKRNKKVKVGIIDTAIESTVADLPQESIKRRIKASEMSQDENTLAQCRAIGICNQHGTKVASIIAAQTNNTIGISGMAPDVELYEYAIGVPVKIPGQDDYVIKGGAEQMALAVNRAIEDGVNVLNISMSSEGDYPPLQDAIERAHASGIVIVATAGNDDGTKDVIPAKYEPVIAVAAYNQFHYPIPYYNKGKFIDITAPTSVPTINSHGAVSIATSGTSVAAPFVTATVALMLENEPDLTPDQIRGRLYSTTKGKPTKGDRDVYGIRNKEVGYGKLNPAGALGIDISNVELIHPLRQFDIPQTRLYGDSRFETAVAISHNSYLDPGNAQNVIIARHDQFPDSIAASSFARHLQAPILLTQKDDIHPATMAELKRLYLPGKKAYILGGTSAISDSVMKKVSSMGYVIERIGGATRVETSVRIAEKMINHGRVNNIVLSDGEDFQSSILASNEAANSLGVHLLYNKNHRSPELVKFLSNVESTNRRTLVAKELPVIYRDIERKYISSDILELSSLLFRVDKADRPRVAFASANDFPDGLAGVAHASKDGTYLLLFDNSRKAQSVSRYRKLLFERFHSSNDSSITIYGGDRAVPQNEISQIFVK